MRYVAAVDYGSDEKNNDNPRWAVFRTYFIWAGNHGTVRDSAYCWTQEDAVREMDKLNALDDLNLRRILIIGGMMVVLGLLILGIVKAL